MMLQSQMALKHNWNHFTLHYVKKKTFYCITHKAHNEAFLKSGFLFHFLLWKQARQLVRVIPEDIHNYPNNGYSLYSIYFKDLYILLPSWRILSFCVCCLLSNMHKVDLQCCVGYFNSYSKCISNARLSLFTFSPTQREVWLLRRARTPRPDQ